jgi:hypothetical protein
MSQVSGFFANSTAGVPHAMVITTWLHMYRVFLTGSYKPPREFNWVVGVILLLLTLLLSFTGYLLPWDQLGIWAITVGSNMAQGDADSWIRRAGPTIADDWRHRHDHRWLRCPVSVCSGLGLSVRRRSTGSMCCTVLRSRWRWRCFWQFISGVFAKTVASAVRCRRQLHPEYTPLFRERRMHSNGFFLSDVAGFLGGYYTFLAIMNGVAALILWRRQQRNGWATGVGGIRRRA